MTSTQVAPPNLLEAIVAAARRIVGVREERESLSTLARRAEKCEGRPGRLLAALDGTGSNGRHAVPRVIAECKRRSPSRGVLRAAYDPAAIAKGYERAGAAAISVLTEPTFFDGALEHLLAVRAAVGLPLLRKDFLVSEYQLFEAKASGADAVLLIVAALERAELRTLHDRATALGLDVLVEVHDDAELTGAVDAGARMIGVNNRNLRTLAVDVGASDALMARMPRGVVAVSESGLRTAGDLLRLRRLGYHAFLIGERFMTANDPGEALGDLLKAATAEPESLRSRARSS